MGIAVDGVTDGSGRIAYIFADRIGQMAWKYLATFDHGLGHAMAHEVGHLLLGAHSHAPAGLMTAHWYPLETHLQTLTPEQVQVIRVRARGDRGSEPRGEKSEGTGPLAPCCQATNR
jgi:hypothetical protein